MKTRFDLRPPKGKIAPAQRRAVVIYWVCLVLCFLALLGYSLRIVAVSRENSRLEKELVAREDALVSKKQYLATQINAQKRRLEDAHWIDELSMFSQCLQGATIHAVVLKKGHSQVVLRGSKAAVEATRRDAASNHLRYLPPRSAGTDLWLLEGDGNE